MEPMHIAEVPGSQPVDIPPYRTSYKEREVLRGIIDQLKSQGVTRDSTSDYSSPVLLITKKTGESRMAVDYRKFNAQMVKDKFPLPRIEDMLDRLSGMKLFCLLDACQGFYQVPWMKSLQEKPHSRHLMVITNLSAYFMVSLMVLQYFSAL